MASEAEAAEDEGALNVENISSELKGVTEWRQLGTQLGLQPDKLREIENEHPTDIERCKVEAVNIWLRSTPGASWRHIVTALREVGEITTAERIELKHVKGSRGGVPSLRDLSLLPVPNWYLLGLQLGISGDELDVIERNYPRDNNMCKLRMFGAWLRGDSNATYEKLARALATVGKRNIAEAICTERGIQLTVLGDSPLLPPTLPPEGFKGTAYDKESTVHFEEAMESGYVECTMTTCAVTGAAGSGKTCTMYLVLNEDQPDVRQSTGLVEPVRALSTVVGAGTSESGSLEWSRVDEDKLLGIVAGATSVTSAEAQPAVQTSPSPPAHSTTKETLGTFLPLAKPQDMCTESLEAEQVSKLEQGSYTSHTEVVDKLLMKLAGLLSKPVGKTQVTKLDFLYFLDSGGQPQFHELLPSFVPNLSTILFVLKLSEKLSQHPVIEYYEEDKLACSYQSPHSHEQILKHCIRALQPENRSTEGGSSPHVAVVGTHRDEESQCEGETREEKNQKLLDLLRPRFGDSLIFYHQLKDLIFPVNAKNPTKEDRAVAGKLVNATIHTSAPKPVLIPLPWFMLEQVLRKLAKERGTGVMHIDECREVASRLRIKPNAFDAALKYLVSLNLFLYYPTVLPAVVFCVPQVFLDKINELVQHHHFLCGGSSILPGMAASSNATGLSGRWLRFKNYGVFQEKLLHNKAFSRHYDIDLFTPADFLKLLESLLIVGKVNTTDIHTEYVMPSLLFESDKLVEHRCNPQTSRAAPLLIHFPGEWPTSGVFCSLAASLLSTQKWEVMTDASYEPTCLHKNCFQFQHPRMPGSITLIDSFDRGYFEVHVDDDAPLEECSKYCPEIRQSVFAALPPKAPLEAEVAFFCPNSDARCPSSLHLAYMKPLSDYWHCSVKPAKVYGCLAEAPNMTVWGITRNSASDKLTELKFLSPAVRDTIGIQGTLPSDVASQPTPKICSPSGSRVITTGYLRGVDVIGETSFLVTSQVQTFNWKGYGLKLHIPEGSLPAKLEQCRLHIKVGLSGQFAFPQNTSLVSAVYWLDTEPRCKFSEAITVEIQHCAKPTQRSRLSFVRAKCSQKDLPYTFKILDGGVFTQHTNFGCISLNGFSFLSVLKKLLLGDHQQQSLDEDPYYCASLYYIGSKFTFWKVHFVVTAELDAYSTAVSEHLKDAILGTSVPFEFEGGHDRVSLDIPRNGTVEGDWSITPLVPLVIIKEQVDNSGSVWSPCLQLEWMRRDTQQPAGLCHQVTLQGAKEPSTFLTIQSDPLPPQQPPQAAAASGAAVVNRTHGQREKDLHSKYPSGLDSEPELADLMNEVAAEIPSKWRDMGVQLGLDHHRLDAIALVSPGDTNLCFSNVFSLWKKQARHPYTWLRVVQALQSAAVQENRLATEIEMKLTQQLSQK